MLACRRVEPADRGDGAHHAVAHGVTVELVAALGHRYERTVQQHRRHGRDLVHVGCRVQLAAPDRVPDEAGREAAQVVAPADQRFPDAGVGGSYPIAARISPASRALDARSVITVPVTSARIPSASTVAAAPSSTVSRTNQSASPV
jgi:hypothetical protein